MTRTTMTSIARTCPGCGTPNNIRIITTEIVPSWDINCSRCGVRIVERRTTRPPLAAASGNMMTEKEEIAPGHASGTPAGAATGLAAHARSSRLARQTVQAGIGAVCAALLAILLANALPGAVSDGGPPAMVAAGDSDAGPVQHAAEANAGFPGVGRVSWPDTLRRVASVEDEAYPQHEPPPLMDPEEAEEALELTARERREVQRRLRLAEHDPQLVDGIFGPATRAAIAAWQESAGLRATGYLDGRSMVLLSERTDEAYRAWQVAERARRERERVAALESPVPAASPERPGPDGCRRGPSGEVIYGQGLRCDFRGLRENARRDFRGLRQTIGLFGNSGADGA